MLSSQTGPKNRLQALVQREDGGALLVIVLIALLSLSVLGVGTMYIAGQHNESSIRARRGTQAHYVCEAGVNHGISLAEEDPQRVTFGYETSRYNSTDPDRSDFLLTDDLTAGASGTPMTFLGGATAQYGLRISDQRNAAGQSVRCGLTGFSERFGSMRYQIDATGYLGQDQDNDGSVSPGEAWGVSECCAVALLAPREGLCPQGGRVVGGYQGSSS